MFKAYEREDPRKWSSFVGFHISQEIDHDSILIPVPISNKIFQIVIYKHDFNYI
jgi:hypothetical protein